MASKGKNKNGKSASASVGPDPSGSGLRPAQVERVLASGAFDGITPGSAKRLVAEFGSAALYEISVSDPKAKSILGDKFGLAGDEAAEHGDALPLLSWLLEQGFSGTMARRSMVWQRHESEWGTPAEALADWKKDPYQLSQIPGIIFERADRIALSLGTEPDGLPRVLACAKEALRVSCDNAGGGARLSDASAQARKLLAMNAFLPPKKINELASGCFEAAQAAGLAKIAVDEQGQPMLFTSDLYFAEERSAHILLGLAGQESPLQQDGLEARVEALEASTGLALHDEQREALATMFKGRVSIVCGKPGSGKTTLLKCAAPLLEAGGRKVLYAAPTGKAAKRMSKSLGRHASTLHRLLAVGFGDKAVGSKGKGGLDSDSALQAIRDADAIVVDEASMLDSMMFLRLLKALGPKTSLILMGDPQQLPSVGAGKVLLDLIESKRLPTAIMTKVMRQSAGSTITKVARAVGDGQWVDFNDKQGDCVMLEAPLASSIAPRIAKMLLGGAKGKYDPLRDAQVLAAGNVGPAGVHALNAQLQELLNPLAPGKQQAQIKEGLTLRQGDKVMQLSNDYERVLVGVAESKPALSGVQAKQMLASEASELALLGMEAPAVPGSKKGVFNGDVGYVESVSQYPLPGKVVVRYDDGLAQYDFKEAASALTLSYACTVHKFQGSEAPLIFFVMHESTSGMLRNRNLVYTAITRAKTKCLVLGSEETLKQAVKRDALAGRRTRLKGLLDGSITVDETASAEVLALSEKQGFARMVQDKAADLLADQMALDLGFDAYPDPVGMPTQSKQAIAGEAQVEPSAESSIKAPALAPKRKRAKSL